MSSISVGIVLHDILSKSDVKSSVTKIYPIVTAEAKLPYVYYEVTGMEQNPVKGSVGADTVHVEVNCLASTYGEAVELAEKVRGVLDCVQASTDDGLRIRSCHLTNMSHTFDDDAFIVSLDFTVRVNQN